MDEVALQVEACGGFGDVRVGGGVVEGGGDPDVDLVVAPGLGCGFGQRQVRRGVAWIEGARAEQALSCGVGLLLAEVVCPQQQPAERRFRRKRGRGDEVFLRLRGPPHARQRFPEPGVRFGSSRAACGGAGEYAGRQRPIPTADERGGQVHIGNCPVIDLSAECRFTETRIRFA